MSINIYAKVEFTIDGGNVKKINIIDIDEKYRDIVDNDIKIYENIKKLCKTVTETNNQDEIVNILVKERSKNKLNELCLINDNDKKHYQREIGRLKLEIEQNDEKYQKEICELNKKLSNNLKMVSYEQEIVRLTSLIENKKTIVDTGIIGEEIIFSHLNNYIKYNNVEIVDTRHTPHSGDINLKYNELNCCIEIKNYASAVCIREINKFKEAMKIDTYNSGIMISINTGYANNSNIHDMYVEIVEGKPCIFITKYNDYIDKLDIAIRMLDTLVSCLNSSNITEVNEYIVKFQELYTNHNTMITQLNNISKSITTLKTIIKKNKDEINNMINIEQIFKTKCGKVLMSQSGYDKHIKTCKNCD